MRPESHQFEALGTTCSLFAIGQSRDRLVEGEEWVHELGARLTRFGDGSELSLLNNHAGDWCAVGAETEAVLRAALRAHDMSAGLVNVALLSSMLAIGYTRPLAEGHGEVLLDTARPIPSLREVLDVRAGEARVAKGFGVDLGGIAKGWMADRLSAMLGPNCVANIGGDLRAVGGGPEGLGWPVAVAGVTLMLRDQAAATSSVRRRRWAGVHHLIDPRTGLPASTGLEEVSVVTATAFEGEVVAKTALLLGRELAPAYCAAHAMAWRFDA